MDTKGSIVINSTPLINICPNCKEIYLPQLTGNTEILRHTNHDGNSVFERIEHTGCRICGFWYLYREIENNSNSFWSSVSPTLYPTKTDLNEAYNNLEIYYARQKYLSRHYLSLLSHLISRSSKFISFLSWNISEWFLGALSVAASSRNIQVFGVVSGVNHKNEYIQDTILKPVNKSKIPFDIYFVSREQFNKRQLGSHNKFICFDGLAMVHGTANLTLSGIQNASDKNNKRDALYFEDDVMKTIKHHNEFFPHVWTKVIENRKEDRRSGRSDADRLLGW